MALESSPEVLNNLLSRIGAPEKYKVDMILLCRTYHLSSLSDPRRAGHGGGGPAGAARQAQVSPAAAAQR